jgi:dTDP-glucose 4,6-dehydratase
MMRLLFSSLFIFTLLSAEFYTLERHGKTEAYVFSYLDIDTKNPLASFRQVVFNFPALLDYVHKNSDVKKVVLMVPKELGGRSPLDDEAALYEGARVALSWASAYVRFEKLGNLDIRVLLCDKKFEGNELAQQVDLLSRRVVDVKKETSPETQMKARCFSDAVSGLYAVTDEASILRPFNSDSLIKTVWNVFPQVTFGPVQEGKKRFVVTGGAGFLGMHLVQRLLKEGNQVIVIDNGLCCDSRNFEVLRKLPNCAVVNYDVTVPFFVQGSIDWVIHLASVPSPVFYYDLPLETLQTGLNGTLNCMDLALNTGAKFLFASTSEVYGDPEVNPQPETYVGNVSPIGKRCQYDQSKRGAETLIKLYTEKNKDFDARMVRIFNTYGPYMRLQDGRFITHMIEAVLANKPIRVYGDGKQTRSFGYAADTVDGIVRLVKHEFNGQEPIEKKVFNVGNQQEMSINDAVVIVQKLAKKIFNRDIGRYYEKQIDATDPTKRCPDLTRTTSVLGYQPTIMAEEGIEQTIRYFLPSRTADLN